MNKPVLVIMAAGMGSRYGGLKQIAPVDENDHVIMDYSMYDAKRAGFEKAICIIKREMEADFEERIASRIRPHMELCYAFQDINALPEGYSVPQGRTKPWGTSHAVLSAKAQIQDAPFAVINADDFYGHEAYQAIFDYLSAPHKQGEYAMVGYLLKNTVSDNGHVARGVCRVNEQGYLAEIQERLRIEKREDGIAYTEDEGRSYVTLDPDTPVSLNLWGYDRSFLEALEEGLVPFLEEGLRTNPLKCEYLVPRTTNDMLQAGRASVRCLHCPAKWFGVTYKEDMPALQEAIRDMKSKGLYPELLWP